MAHLFFARKPMKTFFCALYAYRRVNKLSCQPEIDHNSSFSSAISKCRFLVSGKTFCQSCKKKCSGEVLRVQDKYFHIGCFKCAQCNTSLAQGGFFAREGTYYCTKVSYRRRIMLNPLKTIKVQPKRNMTISNVDNRGLHKIV